MSLDDLLEGDTAKKAVVAGINLTIKAARVYNGAVCDVALASMNKIGQLLVVLSESVIEDGEVENEDIDKVIKTLDIGLGDLRAIRKLIDYIMP